MTVWAPERIAGFARAAGLADAGLVTAVAVAMAASDGDDSAHVLIPAAGDADWRGLWLVRASLVDQGAADTLYDPVASAEAVARLTGGNGEQWEWSEVYRAGSWRAQLSEALAATSPTGRPSGRLALGTGPNLGALAPAMRETSMRLAGGMDAIYQLSAGN